MRKAPLLLLVALLATCDFSLKIEQPAVELDLDTAYIAENQITFYYKFITEESVLRCRYALNAGSQEIFSDVSGLLTPGVLYEETLSIPAPYGEGNYGLHIVGQVGRSGGFVDVASLSRTVEFSIDRTPPLPPEIGINEGWRYLVDDQISLDHGEWPPTNGSPVRLRYNFDGDPLAPDATEIPPLTGETWIEFPPSIFSAGPHTLRALAIDNAGNPPSDVESKQFYFFQIDSAIDSVTLSNRGIIGGICNVELSGYTFQPTDTVEFHDADGTKAMLFGNPMIENDRIQVGIDLRPSESPGINPGTGHIRVSGTSPNAISATTEFIIIQP